MLGIPILSSVYTTFTAYRNIRLALAMVSLTTT